jgi:hypothetical protein
MIAAAFAVEQPEMAVRISGQDLGQIVAAHISSSSYLFSISIR